jgi:ubiquinone/menaquinone biosynthesis C-methylase UbiE
VFKGITSRAIWTRILSIARPEQDYRSVWNQSARTNVIDAICHKHDKNDFEATGKATVDNLILPIMPKDPVALDVGCGIGRIETYLAPHCRKLYAVDVSDGMIAMARERLKGIDNVVLDVVDGTSLRQFDDSLFDFVFSLLVLQHMEKEDAYLYLEEMHRVLKPRGVLYLQFPNLLTDVYFNSFMADVRSNPPRKKNRVRPYTAPEVEFLMRKVGFTLKPLSANVVLGAHDEPVEIFVVATK